MLKNGIKQEFSCPYSPMQNGTSERSWRTLFNMARCLLFEKKLPKYLWNYALRMSAYIRNRCLNARTKITPYESFTGTKPNLSNLHAFGTQCNAYEQIKSKLDPRSTAGIFVGYDLQSPAYLVYFPEKRSIKRVRCVTFHDKYSHQNVQTVQPPICEDYSPVMLPRITNELDREFQ